MLYLEEEKKGWFSKNEIAFQLRGHNKKSNSFFFQIYFLYYFLKEEKISSAISI
jgi:hypothetical protein